MWVRMIFVIGFMSLSFMGLMRSEAVYETKELEASKPGESQEELPHPSDLTSDLEHTLKPKNVRDVDVKVLSANTFIFSVNSQIGLTAKEEKE